MRDPINTKQRLKEFIRSDSSCIRWADLSVKDRMIKWITRDTQYYILRFLKYMRKDEYLEYTCHGKMGHILWMINRRKKNSLGHLLEIDLYSESFDEGLSIFHGNVVVHPSAKAGKNCKLHGHNCIGNAGKKSGVPCIGDNLDLGVGACIIGEIQIKNNVVVGANAVVNKSFSEDDLLLVGVPAHIK